MKNEFLLRFLAPLVSAVLAVNVISMPAAEYPGDAQSVRMEAITLLNGGGWAVPENVATQFGPRGNYFYQTAAGRWYPKYGVLNTLIYLPFLWLEKIVTGRVGFDTDHTIFLNLLNLVAAAATALYLALLARRYSASKFVVSLYVLASIYSTFWWNYLRAQTFETYLPLMMIAFFYHLMRARDLAEPARGQLLAAACSFGVLCLCKTVFVALLPVIAFLLLFRHDSSSASARFRGQFMAFWLPVALCLVVLLVTNWAKFDSALNTGYTQWQEEQQLFTSNVLPALRGYLFDRQQSIFVHFPVLIFALPAWPIFLKRNRPDAVAALLLASVLIILHAARPEWRGAAGYGPRYLLPVAPILAIPFVHCLNWLAALSSRMTRAVSAVLLATILGWSLLLQVALNSLPFYFWNELVAIADDPEETGASEYLHAHHLGTVDLEFLCYARGYRSRFVRGMVDRLTPAGFARLEGLKAETNFNSYWYPRPVEGGR